MGRKQYFTVEQEEWLRNHYFIVSSYKELTEHFNKVFGTERKQSQISEKCTKSLRLKGMPNPTCYGKKEKEQLPIGSIRKSQTGTYIKVLDCINAHITGYAEPYWLPLQKKIYQDVHGEIEPGKMVCFLDGNTDNFDIDNLYCIDRKISAVMSSNHWWTDNREHTLTAIKWCELYYAMKGIANERPN